MNLKNYCLYKMNTDWITANYDKLKFLKLKDLHIPGSHDSAAYKVDFDLCSIFKEPYLGPLFKFLSLVPCITRKFTRTQNLSIYEQLRLGARYIDLRICKLNGIYHCSHTYICDKLVNVLDQIKIFNSQYPKEIIIINYNPDYYYRDTVDMQIVGNYIINYFDSTNKNITWDTDPSVPFNQTIETLIKDGPIIPIYNIHTVWLNKNNMIDFAKNYPKELSANFYGINCVLTPNTHTNFLLESLYNYSLDMNKFIVKQPITFMIYAFDYVNTTVVDFIISKNF